jgi:hypothetical protein
MSHLAVASTARTFHKGNTPFFYLADTAWSIFTNAEEEEWLEYLRYRSEQGFNVFQATLLPILHDNSTSRNNLFPFERHPDGSIDFYSLNTAYFQHVATMLEQATHYGLTCGLVLLWCNYVRDTWISQQSPAYVIPLDAIKTYVEYVVTLLNRYSPIYIISGDTDFRSQATIQAYLESLNIVKRLAPESLACLHLSPYTDLPEEITQARNLDFYMYQSGHRLQEQSFCYTLAERFYSKVPQRPVVNGEPCYEGHGYGFEYGRYSAISIRKAFWQSVLSGACAGFTYGAHGVWSWHQHGAVFNNEEWSKTPFDWRTALRFPGAWDVAYGKWLLERYSAYELVPHNELLNTNTEEIRLATTPDQRTLFIYLPYNVRVEVKQNLSAYSFEGVNLDTRHILHFTISRSDEQSTIEMSEANSDILIIGRRA